jgi:hypothetical protein
MKTKVEWKSKANWKDPKWKYKPSFATDVAKTIARVHREIKKLGIEPNVVKISFPYAQKNPRFLGRGK